MIFYFWYSQVNPEYCKGDLGAIPQHVNYCDAKNKKKHGLNCEINKQPELEM